jgi:glycyl-tRNA synthetase beta chain
MPDFLLEIGCEEIPARMIDAASAELRERVAKILVGERLTGPLSWDESAEADDPGGLVRSFATPRRLAVLVREVVAQQPDRHEHVGGPSFEIAFKDGRPTKAAVAFAKRVNVDISVFEEEAKTARVGAHLGARISKKGRMATEVLAEILPKEISAIYWPKNMYWRKTKERFVRPVRWLVALLDDEVIPLEFDGIWAGNVSRGHRILSDGGVTISRAGSAYVEALRAAKVLGRAERERQIRKALDAATRSIPGARWREDKSLLDAVVNLTEFPSVILGGFDPQFLELPEEVLVTVMRDHQKYFALEDANGKLLPHFLAVLNTDGDPQGLIRHGNERVLRARFNDARFFWQTDQKRSLLERLELLRSVTFQKDLGSYFDKTRRVQRLCSWLSEIVKQSGMAVRAGVIHKAACLAKADLTAELVKEFTELQGIVGGLYARAQELDPGLPAATRVAIADAVYDHYKPESTEDEVPRTIEGAVLSLGDKADTIAGMFALGLVPSGSKDPFALRRQANAIVKIVDKYKLPFRLSQLMRDARAGYQKSEAEKKFVDDVKFVESTRTFFRERLEFYLKDVLEYSYDVVKAVLAAEADDVLDVLARAEAVKDVLHLPEFIAIGSACKRIRNILRQAEEKGIVPAATFEYLADSSSEEKALAAFVEVNAAKVETLRREKKYSEALTLLSTARGPVDAFFDKVMVMAEDAKVRANRLALLRTLLKEFSTIADFSEIVTEGKS